MKILRELGYILLIPFMLIWQPFTLIGILFAIFYYAITFGYGGNVRIWRKGLTTSVYYEYAPYDVSICFGFLTFHSRSPLALEPNANMIPIEINDKHEYGHSIQAWRWGPLYPFVIGIPSLYCYWKIGMSRLSPQYFMQYPEEEADFLGGVTKSERTRYGYYPSPRLKA